MRNKRWTCMYIMGSVLLTAIIISGCQKVEQKEQSAAYIYYVNNTRTTLEKEAYETQNKPVRDEVALILEKLQASPESSSLKSAFPKGVAIENFKLKKGKLDIYFNQDYEELKKSDEVLLRAAVVQSVVQVKGVEYVSFFAGENPIKDSAGNLVGYMQADDFVKNTGSSLHTYQLARLQLYFANKKGDKLVKEEVSIRYNSNMSVEKLIVEQLIKGPAVQEHQPTLPPETKVLGVSTKDNICYVNFDESFLNAGYSTDTKICIYAIVNSIVDAGAASQVQISVNGETDVQLQGNVDLSKPFSRDLDIVEETK